MVKELRLITNRENSKSFSPQMFHRIQYIHLSATK